MSNIFALITIFPLIKPEKQVSGMAENVCIHFLVLISMEESAGEGGAGADPVWLCHLHLPMQGHCPALQPLPAPFSSPTYQINRSLGDVCDVLSKNKSDLSNKIFLTVTYICS